MFEWKISPELAQLEMSKSFFKNSKCLIETLGYILSITFGGETAIVLKSGVYINNCSFRNLKNYVSRIMPYNFN